MQGWMPKGQMASYSCPYFDWVGQPLYSPDLNSAASLRLGLMLADSPGLEPVVLALASHEAALACSAVGAS